MKFAFSALFFLCFELFMFSTNYAQSPGQFESGLSFIVSTPFTHSKTKVSSKTGTGLTLNYVYPSGKTAEWKVGINCFWLRYSADVVVEESGHFEAPTITNFAIKIPVNRRFYFSENGGAFFDLEVFGMESFASSIRGKYISGVNNEVVENEYIRLNGTSFAIGGGMGLGTKISIPFADLYFIAKYSYATAKNTFQKGTSSEKSINYGCYPEIQVLYRF